MGNRNFTSEALWSTNRRNPPKLISNAPWSQAALEASNRIQAINSQVTKKLRLLRIWSTTWIVRSKAEQDKSTRREVVEEQTGGKYWTSERSCIIRSSCVSQEASTGLKQHSNRVHSFRYLPKYHRISIWFCVGMTWVSPEYQLSLGGFSEPPEQVPKQLGPGQLSCGCWSDWDSSSFTNLHFRMPSTSASASSNDPVVLAMSHHQLWPNDPSPPLV